MKLSFLWKTAWIVTDMLILSNAKCNSHEKLYRNALISPLACRCGCEQKLSLIRLTLHLATTRL